MAPRVMSAASDDSLKENAAPKGLKAGKVKQEQNKDTRVARGKAPAKPTRRRVENDEKEEESVEEHNEEEEDVEDDEDEDEGSGSPKGRKRVRVNTEGDSRPAEASSPKKEKNQTLPRDEDGFVPGAIVRVKLENFVTYDSAEFRPGPYLNMILGPNGTGKSTIACAICLGLNFPPSVLGRASELSSFVKIGTESAYIEIELKGKKGKSNLIIKRILKARSKSSTFTLNGTPASGREINARMAELNVQISNLCTFLPQDKVSEFARMSPQQLLRETQRAAGNANLTSWHDTLISTGKELKQLQDAMTVDHDRIQTMRERNENLEREVQRFNERRQIERKIELFELILPFKEYMEAKEAYATAKAKQRQLHERVKALKAKNAPVLDFKQQLEDRILQRQTKREAKKNASKNKFATLQRKFADNEKIEADAETMKNELESLKRNEKNRLKEIAKLEKAVADLQQQLANPVKTEDIQVINDEMARLTAENRKTRERQDELHDRQRANITEESRYKANLDQVMYHVRQLDDASHRQLESLGRWDRDAADVVRWLRNHKDRFKMEIFEPSILSVTVPDKRFVNAVEACFSSSNMKTFVAQCEEDYATLNRLVVDTPDAIGRKARINTWYRVEDDRLRTDPPMTVEEMKNAGFDGYALEYVHCPEGLKWWLKCALQLHRTAIALDPRRVDPNRAMELVSRSGGARYIVGNIFNNVTRSRYGQRLAQNSTGEVKPARNLVHAAVDPAVKQRLDAQIAEANKGITLCKEEADVLSKDEAEIQAAHKAYRKEHEALNSRKADAVAAKRKYLNMQQKLVDTQDKLKSKQNQPSVDVERERLKAKLLVLARKRADIIKNYSTTMREIIKEQEEATRIGLEYLQLCANKDALETMCKEQEEEYQAALREYTQAHKRYETVKQDSKVKLQVSKEKLDSVDDEIRAQFQEMETSGEANAKSAEEVQAELDKLQAQLDMSLHTNPGVVEQYNRRKAEIESLNAVIEERAEKVEKTERQIKAAKDNWHPALQDLVNRVGARFSAAFDRLGCAGEIKIREHEDYDKWAIDILVKFRDSEKLQLLTAERQSGGERSLTTILYLMSLTEEARAPFSLVDEINQGMDQRAERAVHDSLVEVTCKPDSGQYFLITPKLLPDLNYEERMTILCILNGEWVEVSGELCLMNVLQAHLGKLKVKSSKNNVNRSSASA